MSLVPPRPDDPQPDPSAALPPEEADDADEAARRERFVATADSELNEGRPVQPQWDQALGLAGGDEDKARALYTELRAGHLERRYQEAADEVLEQQWGEVVRGEPFLCPYCERRSRATCRLGPLFSRNYSCDACGAVLAPAVGGVVPAGRRVSRGLLAGGGLAGMLASFLPLATVTGMVSGLPAQLAHPMVYEDLRGVAFLLCSAAAVLLALVLYPAAGLRNRSVSWAAVAIGGLQLVLAVWLLSLASPGVVSVPRLMEVRTETGGGTLLCAAAAVVVVLGGLLKTREERLW